MSKISYKELFKNEVCKCGKKGDYIIPNGSGGIKGFECEECHQKKVKENE